MEEMFAKSMLKEMRGTCMVTKGVGGWGGCDGGCGLTGVTGTKRHCNETKCIL